MSEKLKPCPFCGHDGAVYNDSLGNHWARCPQPNRPVLCGVSFPTRRITREQAVKDWNTRMKAGDS